MQPYRITTRAFPRICKASVTPTRTIFTSPFFPHNHFGPASADFAPLFRLLDNATSDLVPSTSRGALQAGRRTFTPRFDVREQGSAYELQGELPGIEQKDLQIEFVDDTTLVIRGWTATESSSTNEHEAVDGSEKKASVEDEHVDARAESASSEGVQTPGTEVAEQSQQQPAKTAEPSFKYWVSERSVGEFERRFSFPGRVDQEAVKASLKNGILSVVVPKIVAKEARRIKIQ